MLLSVSTTVWHVNYACLLYFVKQRPCSLFIVLNFEILVIINASRIFPLFKSSVHDAERAQVGYILAGQGCFPARGSGGGGWVTDDQGKGLVVTELSAITTFQHSAFRLPPCRESSPLLLQVEKHKCAHDFLG